MVTVAAEGAIVGQGLQAPVNYQVGRISAAAGEELCPAETYCLRALRDNKQLDVVVFEGSCSGPCSKESAEIAKRDLAELEAKVESGDASESELDYNFTDCLSLGAALIGAEVVGRTTVVSVRSAQLAPHGTVVTHSEYAVLTPLGRWVVSPEVSSPEPTDINSTLYENEGALVIDFRTTSGHEVGSATLRLPITSDAAWTFTETP